MRTRQVFVDGHSAIVEMMGEAKTKKGEDYNNVYCWVMEFRQEKIISARVYFDDVLVDRALVHNE
jgi:ketosteroid isomerase-like protein